MKPTGAFKLSKSSKRVLATMTDRHAAGHFKKMMIDAELAEKVVVRVSRNQRSEAPKD